MERIFEKNSAAVRRIIVCPVCRNSLKDGENNFSCALGHGAFFVDADGRWHLIQSSSAAGFAGEHRAGVNRIKSWVKACPRLYYFLWHIFCPVFLSGPRPSSALAFLPPGALVINLGSGPRRLSPAFINVDAAPFPEVDIVADAALLPFADNSVDGVAHESLLEHVPDPHAVVREMVRVLKPGGMMYASIPFLTPYHASPDDFNRWTGSGLRRLFSDFEIVREGADAGPWSAGLVFLAYSLGVLFSFGRKKHAPALGLVFMALLGPLKFLDFFFARMPGAHAVAAQLYFIGRKK